MKMRRVPIVTGLLAVLFLAGFPAGGQAQRAHAGKARTSVIDVSGARQNASVRRAILRGTGRVRARRAKVSEFGNGEMSARLARSVAGRDVHITQAGTSEGNAVSIFRVLQAVEASHMGGAASVRVSIGDGIGRQFGRRFIADLLKAVDVRSVRYVGKDTDRTLELQGRSAKAADRMDDRPREPSARRARQPLLWGGSSHPELVERLGRELSLRGERVHVAWGSSAPVKLPADPRGREVYLVQTKRLSDPEQFHAEMLEMLRIGWEAQRKGAKRITLISPYLPYSRSDRMDTPGTSVGASLLPQLMKRVGIGRVVFYSVHQAQELGIFQALRMQAIHASGESVLARRAAAELRRRRIPHRDLVVMAPDAGAEKRARVFARHLAEELGVEGLAVVTANKERLGRRSTTRFNAPVRGKHTIAIDDETASGGTLNNLAEAAKEGGARTVFAAVSHLAGAAHERIDPRLIDKLFVLDTLPQERTRASGHPSIEVVGVAEHLGGLLNALRKDRPIEPYLFLEHP